MRKWSLTGLIAFLFALAAFQAGFSQSSKPSLFQTLNGKDMVDVTLELPLDSIQSSRQTNEYYPGVWVFKVPGKGKVRLPVKVRARGKFRRKVCDFPPLKLKFPKSALEEQGLRRKYNEYKLVTHCMSDRLLGWELLLREMLAYQLYQELTEYSYRVQLVRITYRDPASGKRLKRLGVLLEDKEELEDRLDGEVCDCMGLPAEQFHPTLEKVTSLFQFMIGNTDWSYLMNRNVELLRDHKTGKIIPIPYDFDFSAFVNAPYARPSSDLGQTTLRQRIYLGLDTEYESLRSVISYFRTKREALLQRIYRFKWLSEPTRNALAAYLLECYEQLETVVPVEGLPLPE